MQPRGQVAEHDVKGHQDPDERALRSPDPRVLLAASQTAGARDGSNQSGSGLRHEAVRLATRGSGPTPANFTGFRRRS